jgi:hypothetical protein
LVQDDDARAITCPTCRKLLRLPQGGIAELPVNYSLLGLIDAVYREGAEGGGGGGGGAAAAALPPLPPLPQAATPTHSDSVLELQERLLCEGRARAQAEGASAAVAAAVAAAADEEEREERRRERQAAAERDEERRRRLAAREHAALHREASELEERRDMEQREAAARARVTHERAKASEKELAALLSTPTLKEIAAMKGRKKQQQQQQQQQNRASPGSPADEDERKEGGGGAERNKKDKSRRHLKKQEQFRKKKELRRQGVELRRQEEELRRQEEERRQQRLRMLASVLRWFGAAALALVAVDFVLQLVVDDFDGNLFQGTGWVVAIHLVGMAAMAFGVPRTHKGMRVALAMQLAVFALHALGLEVVMVVRVWWPMMGMVIGIASLVIQVTIAAFAAWLLRDQYDNGVRKFFQDILRAATVTDRLVCCSCCCPGLAGSPGDVQQLFFLAFCRYRQFSSGSIDAWVGRRFDRENVEFCSCDECVKRRFCLLSKRALSLGRRLMLPAVCFLVWKGIAVAPTW